jgi:DNA ligase-1
MKPMLAAAVKSVDTLTYPMIASPKLDGIRALKVDGHVVSRSLKPIPNVYIRETLEKLLPEGADGEITVGNTFQECTSGVMTRTGEPNFTYWMFDLVDKETGYVDRLTILNKTYFSGNASRGPIWMVPIQEVNSAEELLAYEAEMLKMGFEGVCLRTPDSPYKFGRSTLKQGWLLKLKRFVDAEAIILGLDEQMQNINELETNELGYAQRSYAKDGKIGKNTLGRFRVRDTKTNVEFCIGTGEGLTDALRKKIWDDRENYVWKTVKYKSQPFGVKDAPRLPIFLGFREEDDTDEET